MSAMKAHGSASDFLGLTWSLRTHLLTLDKHVNLLEAVGKGSLRTNGNLTIFGLPKPCLDSACDLEGLGRVGHLYALVFIVDAFDAGVNSEILGTSGSDVKSPRVGSVVISRIRFGHIPDKWCPGLEFWCDLLLVDDW